MNPEAYPFCSGPATRKRGTTAPGLLIPTESAGDNEREIGWRHRMPQYDQIARSAGKRSRSFLRNSRPIARQVFERLKRWVSLLNRRLEKILQKRVPRSQQQLLQVIIQVIAVIALLLLLPYSLYVLLGVVLVLWVQAARDLKREARTDRRLLRRAETDEDFDY